jgi:DNA-binding GntR family transcriptional regulator
VSRNGLREQVTERLLTAVFEKRFASGEHLVVQRISEVYGVSPTPVRESLVELAGLGIVDLLPNRGAVVRAFGPRQLREMSQVRRVLETEATRCASSQIDRPELEPLLAELTGLQAMPAGQARDRRARAADTQLHGLIADRCGNPRLAAEIQRYLALFRALRNVSHLRDSWNDFRRSNDVPEHLKIVKGLITGDGERSARAMEQHIRSVERTLTAVMFEESRERGGR